MLILGIALIIMGRWMQAAADTPDISDMVAQSGIDPKASTLVITRLSDGQAWVSNAARAEQRFSPASTSKLPHTLVALDTGTAQPDTLFKWGGLRTWNPDWNRDHTLQSAFRNSVVWVYQEIVQQVGAPGMQGGMERRDYGNATTGGPDNLTTYWLNDTLQISANEQVDFLTRLAQRRLPLSPETYAAADDIMLADTGDGWELRAKTGWRHGRDIMDIGWYVGWVGCGSDHYVFAFNMDMPDSSFRDFRQSTALSVLTDIGAFTCP